MLKIGLRGRAFARHFMIVTHASDVLLSFKLYGSIDCVLAQGPLNSQLWVGWGYRDETSAGPSGDGVSHGQAKKSL